MKSTGNLLKVRRESLKISIAEVSIATKITPRMLQAIESGDMDMLPARTFLRGFVKSYAGFLKMDVNSVLKAFAEEMATFDPPPPPPAGEEVENESVPNSHEAPSKTSAPLINEGMSKTKKASLIIGLTALISIIVFVYKMVDKYEREGRVEQPPTSLTRIEEAPAKKEEPAKPAAVEPKVVEVKPPETAPAEVKPTEPAKRADPPQQVEAPKPVEAPKKVEAPQPAAVETTKPTETPQPSNTTQEVIIEALDKVEVTFRVNGQSKKVALQPDQYHTIKAAGTIGLELSDGGAVNIIHNGRDLGVPGDLGRPKKLQLQ